MKDKFIAILLAFFMGWFGAHKFYLKKNKVGLLYLLFCWTPIPWLLSIIDIIKLLLMSEHEFNYKYNHDLVPPEVKVILSNQNLSPEIKQIDGNKPQIEPSLTKKIRELDTLRQEGLLTNQEFQEQKKKILEQSVELDS